MAAVEPHRGATMAAAAYCRPPPWISALRASFPKIEGGIDPLSLSLSLFPLLPAAPEAQAAGNPAPLPCFPARGKREERIFAFRPLPFLLFLKEPSHLSSPLLYFKTDPSTI